MHLENFEMAIKRREAALLYAPEVVGIALDAVIPRFECTFALAWKSVRVAAKAVGYECKSPRGCLKLAYKMDWIEDEEKWLRLLEARNFLANANFEMLRFFSYRATYILPLTYHSSSVHTDPDSQHGTAGLSRQTCLAVYRS